MKQIEGDDVSAMEVAHAINVFIEFLEERKKNNYLSTAVKKEIDKVAAECDTASREQVLITTKLFYGWH